MYSNDYLQLLEELHHLHTEYGIHVPVAVWGESGVGKTDIAHQFAAMMREKTGKPFGCWVVKPGQADSAGDLVGMPEKVPYYPCPLCLDEDKATGAYRREELAAHAKQTHQATLEDVLTAMKDYEGLVTHKQRFAITDVWPTQGPGILVIDEINRAPSDLQNSLLGLVEERVMELTGYEVPDGVIIIATANPPTSKYVGVQEIDEAMRTRFVHFNLVARHEDWMQYMRSRPHGQAAQGRRLLRFFQAQPNFVGCREVIENPVLDDLQACPRLADKLVKLSLGLSEHLLMEAARGTLGEQGAVTLHSFLQSGEEFIPAKKILADYSRIRDEFLSQVCDERHDLVHATVDDLLDSLDRRKEMLEVPEMENLVLLLGDVNLDTTIKVGKAMLEARRKAGGNLFRHFEHLESNCPAFAQLMVEGCAQAKHGSTGA